MSSDQRHDLVSDVDDVVRIDVPAVTEQLRLVRLVVSSLATSHGADMDDLEDLRIATGELCAALVSDDRSEGRLLVEVGAVSTGGAARVRLSAVRPDLSGGVDIDDLAAMVLGTTTDSCGVGSAPWRPEPGSDGGARAWFERSVGDRSPDGDG